MTEFNFNYADIVDAPQLTELADGSYDGVIETSEIKATAAGPKMVVLRVKLANGVTLQERLNLENQNPKAREIAQTTTKKIINYGVNKPTANFKSMEQLAAYLKGTPVVVYYKSKGLDDNGYVKYSLTFKPVAPEKKVTKADPTAASSVY